MKRIASFRVYLDAGGQWRWRLVSANGRIIADSAEGYETQRNAEHAARTVIDTVRLRLWAPAVVVTR